MLLNYFSFVNLFELATFPDYCLILINFVQEVYFLFLEMPVNLNQYRAAIGVFNNRILTTSKKHHYFLETSNMKNNLLFTTIINVVVLVFICFMFEAFFNQKKLTALSFLFFTFVIYHPWLFMCLIKISGGVEENPGPKRYSVKYLTICHWNLNSIATHNFIKVVLLKAYLSVHEMEIICLSETY